VVFCALSSRWEGQSRSMFGDPAFCYRAAVLTVDDHTTEWMRKRYAVWQDLMRDWWCEGDFATAIAPSELDSGPTQPVRGQCLDPIPSSASGVRRDRPGAALASPPLAVVAMDVTNSRRPAAAGRVSNRLC